MKRIKLIVEIDELHWEDFIEMLNESGLPVNITAMSVGENDGYSTKELAIQQFLPTLLTNLGIPVSLRGYDYIKAAIIFVLEDPTYLQRKVTSRLYPAIAKEFGTKSPRVERAIRHAVTVSWDRGDRSYLNRLFGNRISELTGKPTNSEYIARIVEVVKVENMISA